MDIEEFKKYRRLVNEKKVPPLLCEQGHEYTLRATTDGDPLLQCAWCNTISQPGLKIYDRVCAVNEEFYNV